MTFAAVLLAALKKEKEPQLFRVWGLATRLVNEEVVPPPTWPGWQQWFSAAGGAAVGGWGSLTWRKKGGHEPPPGSTGRKKGAQYEPLPQDDIRKFVRAALECEKAAEWLSKQMFNADGLSKNLGCGPGLQCVLCRYCGVIIKEENGSRHLDTAGSSRREHDPRREIFELRDREQEQRRRAGAAFCKYCRHPITSYEPAQTSFTQLRTGARISPAPSESSSDEESASEGQASAGSGHERAGARVGGRPRVGGKPTPKPPVKSKAEGSSSDDDDTSSQASSSDEEDAPRARGQKRGSGTDGGGGKRPRV